MLKLFFDTEFTDLKQDCDLISIGVVAVDDEDEYEHMNVFYAESIEYRRDKCSDFVVGNVIPNLALGDSPTTIKTDTGDGVAVLGTEEDICLQLDKWIKQFVTDPLSDSIEVWGDCLAYDWVLFCHLFGGVLPHYICYIPFDICTYMKIKGVDPDISREEFASEYHKEDMDKISGASIMTKHNSLFDAMVIYYCYDILKNKM